MARRRPAWTTEDPLPDAAPRPSHEIWISRGELMRLPTSGPARERLKAGADDRSGSANIANQDSNHDVKTLAVARLREDG